MSDAARVMLRRDLRFAERSAADSERLARVSRDDVTRAREHARRTCTAGYRRFLDATLDTTERRIERRADGRT